MTQQTVKVVFNDEIVDGIPCVGIALEMEEGARSLSEPTPAMYFAIYLMHLFNQGTLMKEVEAYVAAGQFKDAPEGNAATSTTD
jgi:hypothetical protein